MLNQLDETISPWSHISLSFAKQQQQKTFPANERRQQEKRVFWVSLVTCDNQSLVPTGRPYCLHSMTHTMHVPPLHVCVTTSAWLCIMCISVTCIQFPWFCTVSQRERSQNQSPSGTSVSHISLYPRSCSTSHHMYKCFTPNTNRYRKTERYIHRGCVCVDCKRSDQQQEGREEERVQ